MSVRYDQLIAEAHKVLTEHNGKAADKVDIDVFFKSLSDMGGTTEDTLSDATWEDIEECLGGKMRILARRIARIFRAEEKTQQVISPVVPQKVIIEDNDPEKVARYMTPRQLIENYDPKHPKNPIGQQLKKLSEGRKFLVFVDDNLNTDATITLFNELDDFGERSSFIIDGMPRRVYHVGDCPGRQVSEHPLYPNTPLRTGGLSDADCTWGQLPIEVQQLYRIAVDSGELNLGICSEFDLFREASETEFTLLCKKYRSSAIIFQQLKNDRKLPQLCMTLGGFSKPPRPQNPFGMNRSS
jgi:hypothetical protein